MYTQCPDCATVFRVTADALRTAQGNVRCGVCSTSFDALENLSEEPFRATAEGEEAPALEDTITVEESPGNENIELSTPAEDVATPESATEVEAAGSDSANEQSFEFDGNVEDLDRLFVELPATELQHLAAAARLGDQPSRLTIDPGVIAASLSVGDDDDSKLLPHGEGPSQNDPERTDEFPILVLDESDEDFMLSELEPPATPPPATRARPLSKPRAFQPSPFGPPRILIPDEMRKRLADEAAAVDAPLFDEPQLEDGQRRWPWMIGVALLVLAFAAQVVHAKRDDLLRRPAIGPLLAEVYSFVGIPLTSPTDLSAYELRQWGAASDGTQAGRLLLRASIVNRATYAQPYPLLRLALQDRFGTTVAMGDIAPADYLPGAGAGKMLEPGQRADAEIHIVDPGKDAVGFEMDVCLSETGGVRCANEVRPATP